MNKVAIIGIENSHAWSFAKSLCPKDGEKTYEDMDLIGFYADLTQEDGQVGAAKLEKVSACTQYAETPDGFVDDVDAVMITARHGKYHLPYAKPYLQKGIPVWVDKPICTSTEDVVELVNLAKQSGSPVCGGSSLVFAKEIREMAEYVETNREEIIGGHVTAPVSLVNDYGNFWFYSSHLVQMITTVFGFDILSVEAWQSGKTVRAVYHYANMDVTAMFGTGYTVTAYKGSGHAKTTCVTMDGCYDAELHEFYNMVKTGQGAASWREFVMPVFLIDATTRAFEEKREIKVVLPDM